jgi:hypothetical protein
MGKGNTTVFYMSNISSSIFYMSNICSSAEQFLLSTFFKHKTHVFAEEMPFMSRLLKRSLITLVQCKNLWRQFKAKTEYTVAQAITAQVSPRFHSTR